MPATTSYLASMAGTVQDYADTYVGFTTNLITSTFEALVEANHSQMVAYQEMVSVLSQGLTTYINETKDDVSDEEIMEFLSSLSLQKAGLLEENQSVVLNGEATGSDSVLAIETEGEATTTSFGGVASEIVKPGSSAAGAFTSLIPSVVTGIKDVMITADEVSGLPRPADALDPYDKFDDAATERDKELQFIDLVKMTLSRNKYKMLENMVETGLLRLVVDRGLIQTDFRMELKESFVDKEKTSFKHRVKTKSKQRAKTPRSFGIMSIFDRRKRERTKSKRKTLTVSKRKTSTTERNNGTASMGAKIELQFSTDYKPLILDND